MAVLAAVGGVLGRSSSIFFSPSSFPSFILLSLLLFSFRSALHVISLSLTSSIHQNPALHSILTRVSDPPAPAGAAVAHPPPFPQPLYHPHRHQHPQRHQDHPFIHSSRRLPTYDDDDDDEDGIFSITDLHPAYLRQLRPRSTRYRNTSFLFVRRRSFDADPGSGGSSGANDPALLSVQKFRVPDPSPSPAVFTSADHHLFDGENRQEDDRKVRLSGLVLDLDRGDASAVIYLACLFSAAHAYAILGFLLCYSSAFGIVLVSATASLLGKTRPFGKTLYSGVRLGFQRLPPLLFLRWAVRDSMTQFLSLLLFPDITDPISVLKLFVKVKLMPYSLTAPPPSLRFEVGFKGFIFAWTMFDTLVATAFAVNCWIAIMDRNHRRNSREVVKEGCYLISNMIAPALFLRCLELALCGNIGMRVMASFGGYLFAMLLQSIFEIYFLVAWLMIYFAAKCKVGEIDGSRFGWRELEDRFNAVMRPF